MTSAADAIEIAAYTLLTEGEDIGAAVYQDVPEDTPPPVVIIGDVETRPLGTKGEGDRTADLTILTVTEGEERKPCLAIMARITDRLDDVTFEVENWTLGITFEGDDAVLAPSGEGYVGTSRFKILALKA